ncbi:MAG TPA: 2-hydroxyacyl-CoA dehydratase family protein [Thermodesulfobacteriota bacterium]|nr:2-hydroxyacyl-CoA dehydratase family protein [Thermodesulfobacteriota bacterium]
MIAEFREKFEKRHEIAAAIKKNGRKIIGCFYGAVPKELVHAAGMVPIQLMEDKDYRFEAKSRLLPYLCGMSKNLTGQIYDRVFSYVDGVMISTVCDTNRHVPDIWERNKVFPKTWIVRAPIMANEGAVQYYSREVRRLADELGSLSGRTVTEEGLRQSLALYNESRALFRKFCEVRPDSAITAEEAVYVFASALVLPVEEHNAMMRQLLESLKPLPEKDSRIRLMVCALNINLSLEVIRMAEKYGARVVMDDFSHNARYGSEEIEINGDAFQALAQGYLRKIPMPGMYSFERRATHIQDLMKASRSEGLIYIIQLYCDAYAMEYAVLKEYFDRWNLPHLKIEAEDTPLSIEQLNVRVQSFMESLI